MPGRKRNISEHFNKLAPEEERWKHRNRYYHNDQIRHLRYLVGADKRVLEIGCGSGGLLNALNPSYGVGMDLSAALIERAKQKYHSLQFHVLDGEKLEEFPQETFDYIIMSDIVGYLDDVQSCLETLRRFCHPGTRIVISYYNFLWQPILKIGEALHLKMPTPEQSWLSPDDITNLLVLADFETVKIDRRLLFPIYIPLLSTLLNHIGLLPAFNRACLTHYVVARPLDRPANSNLSTSIVIPCRNEKGNIEPAIQRIPTLGTWQETIFVDGHSTDGTQEEIHRVIEKYPQRNIRFLIQDGTGKADAVRKGFDSATGDILMILDADLTVPPEDLPKFYVAMAANKAEFLNGCRLVYPMEDRAMQTLNLIANKLFGMIFSWLLGQRLKDTLCGTKVIKKSAYHQLAAGREYFGNFDPFGDFDLLFGASKLNLRILEVPVRYRARAYGETNIRRFKHGLQLSRMVVYAYRKLKSG